MISPRVTLSPCVIPFKSHRPKNSFHWKLNGMLQRRRVALINTSSLLPRCNPVSYFSKQQCADIIQGTAWLANVVAKKLVFLNKLSRKWTLRFPTYTQTAQIGSCANWTTATTNIKKTMRKSGRRSKQKLCNIKSNRKTRPLAPAFR